MLYVIILHNDRYVLFLKSFNNYVFYLVFLGVYIQSYILKQHDE